MIEEDEEVLTPMPSDPRLGRMPRYYFPHDKKSIAEKLFRIESLGAGMRDKVCDAYAKAYQEAWNAEPLGHRKDGKARFAANTRLRIFIEKRFAVFNR